MGMLKAGTVADMELLAGKMPQEVYREALNIVTMLDENFGEDRDVENDDGGFVAIIEDKESLDYFAHEYAKLDSPFREYIERIETSTEPYLNAFFLYHEYAFGITLLIPQSIAPEMLLKEITRPTQKI